jgi:competence protein ComEC
LTEQLERVLPRSSRWWVVAALGVIVVTRTVEADPRYVWLLLPCIVWLVRLRHPMVATVVTLAAVSAILWSAPMPPLVEGQLSGEGVVASDVVEGRYGQWAIVDIGGPVLANLPDAPTPTRGDHVLIEGRAISEVGSARGMRYRGTIDVDAIEVVAHSASPFLVAGRALRERVRERLAPLAGGRGLVAGFLVGDVTGVEPVDQEAMKRAGLSHFTAVSGSNVALFLTFLFVMTGPLGVGPRRRALIGLIGLPVFVAATGFEPSVMRAAAMAAIVLIGRLVGVTLEAWQVLALAVVTLLVLDPGLVGNAGFQLSAAATGGVIVGARWPTKGVLQRVLSVTAGAQLAVAPLLLVYFGRVPLLSPLTNVAAAPLVSVATMSGAIGVIGLGPAVALADMTATAVLWMARVTAPLPQIGWPGLATVVVLGLGWWGVKRLRSALAVAAAVLIGLALLHPPHQAPQSGVVVFDVGQGDAILLSGGDGHFALVDGGVDPARLLEKVQSYGVAHLDLMVPTHGDADHALGLTALPGRIPIDLAWWSMEPHQTEASVTLAGELAEHQVPVHTPHPGESMRLGSLDIVVVGPLRRYAAPNDQSIVLLVSGARRSMLLTGDIGSVAQSELTGLSADVLKVPHHGAATSDPSWLESIGADLAVISVGPNDYGHPAQWVLDLLRRTGAVVERTDELGDVTVDLDHG